jgi:energy-coupling factor transporter ATP-binding protein EcfA2
MRAPVTSIRTSSLLSVENLSFRYRARSEPAIRNISFDLEAGRILLIAGASGCGKTTLIRCVNGLIPRSYKGDLQGRVLFNGQDTISLPLARMSQMVGTLLQDPERQIVASHVINEVAFGLENLGLSRTEINRRVLETLDHLGIAHLAERETFGLSGGEKQKVALAGVLAMQPTTLLLDEPLASLDPVSAQEALRMVRRLADEGVAVIIIEHRVEDVLSIHPDRALYMRDGQVTYDGSAAGLVTAVDYREVKLPALDVIARARQEPSAPPPLPSSRPAGDALISFEQVSFGYDGGPLVLRDVSLQIKRGDVIAVLGPNGAGKTTLVKHAIGLLKPTRGQVLVNGRDTRQVSVAQVARTLGYVFQSPTHMLFAPSVREELAFGPRNLEMPPAEVEDRVAQAVRTVNLSGLEDYPPLALSFGQQKRVSIASVVAMGSRILAMDEPTAGQDYRNYMTFMDAILSMPDFEAVLFITHDVDLAVVYANRVILVGAGGVAADGPPAAVLSDSALLERCRVVPTSLLRVNLEWLPRTGRFMRAEALAHIVN